MENQIVSEITFEDFLKVDIRSGTVLKAERVPKSKKLFQLEVDFGEVGLRVILAGIGEDFEPENIIGVQIMAVLNLAPRKMMGIESHGMIMAARKADGKLTLATAPGSPNGCKIG